MTETTEGINHSSPSASKITLFRSLFRGREDLYSKRFESRKTGKSGYLPVCQNAWVRGLCEKPRIKCADCGHRCFLPVTDDVVRWHLSGQDDRGQEFVMGVYTMLLNESCFFLAADFDKSGWEMDATAFLKTSHQLNIPAALERSRSGRGAHVWIFFAQAIPAILARKLGCHIITETMEHHPDLGLDSYDRFFPSQDTLPKGGFGNLIALPLQKKARDVGNSVFVNEELIAYEDQWAYLSGLCKMSRSEIETLVHGAESRGRVIGVYRSAAEDDDAAPWNTVAIGHTTPPLPEDLPERLEIVASNEIYISKQGMTPWLKNRLIRLAAFQNPEFYKAQAMRLPTHEKPRVISCTTDHPHHIGLPRGCLDDLRHLLAELKIPYTIRPEVESGCPLITEFCGTLRTEQKVAAEVLLQTPIGVLAASTAFGKTVIAAWLIAKRQVNTLILVHRKQLQEQWIQRLSTFLDLPQSAIGRIGGGSNAPTGHVDVAVIQSLVRKGAVDDVVRYYGHLIVDECHHIPALSFEQIALQSKAKYITGLTATVTRKDGHQPIITMRCGPVRYRVDAKKQAQLHPFDHVVFVRPTSFCRLKAADDDARLRFCGLYDELLHDQARDRLICDDIIRAVQNGRSPIVVTERTKHLDALLERLSPHVPHMVVFRGGMSSKELHEATDRLRQIPDNEVRVVLATGRCIGEGFDDARLDTLFLTLPVSWRGTIAQYVGRLHRMHDKKRVVQVYDYADLGVPMLERMFNRRCQGYEAVGYTILLPASAIPGWPPEVPLPVDPAWKADYAGSVKRLIRDGVDVSLATLFSQVSSLLPQEAVGADRARSATERFLFCRLETLPQTAGRFQLNAELAIPFDGWGRMEVDFVCVAANLVIEIDGSQHLSCVEAYRRDRRKDALLQENGYTVLRFLAEDVGKRLDDILDCILRFLVAYQDKERRV